MSTTPTTSRKRLVALGAVTALAAGVLVPLVATPASAAPVSYTLSNAPIRQTLATEPGTFSVTATGGTLQSDVPPGSQAYYGLFLTSQPTGSTVASSEIAMVPAPSPASYLYAPPADSLSYPFPTQFIFSNVGDYGFAVCRVVLTGAQATPARLAAGCDEVLPDIDPIVGSLTAKVGGQIASFTVAPAAQVVPIATYATYKLTYTDAAGRPTLPLGTDTIRVSAVSTSPLWSTTAAPGIRVDGAFATSVNGSLLAPAWNSTFLNLPISWDIFQGASVFRAQLDKEAIADFRFFHPNNNTIAAQTVRLSTGRTTSGLQSTILLSKNIIAFDNEPGNNLDCAGQLGQDNFCDYWLNTTGASSVPIRVSGRPGAVVQVAYPTFNNTATGAASAIQVAGPSSLQIEADGTADFTVNVTGTIREGEHFQVVFSDGGNVYFRLDFEYHAPYPVPIQQTPPAGSTVFPSNANNTVSVASLWRDQYGNVWDYSPLGVGLFRLVGDNPSTNPQLLVAQGNTDANGVVTLTTTRASATTVKESFFLAALVNGLPAPFPGFYVDLTQFSVWYDQKPVLTITKGVSVAGAAVNTSVPGDAYVDYDLPLAADPDNRPLQPVPDWTPVTVQVTNNGAVVPFAAVQFTGSEGVQFVPFCNGPGATFPELPFTYYPSLPGDPGQGTKDCFYGSTGGNFGLTDDWGRWQWNKGVTTDWVMANANGKGGAFTYTTKTGTNTVNAAAGTQTTQGQFNALTLHWYLRNVSVAPATSTVKPGAFSTVTATGTDAFGNAVPAAPIQATIPATSIGRFTLGAKQTVQNTDTNGQAKFDVTASASEVPVGTTGTATVQVGTNFCYGVPIGSGWVPNQLGAIAEVLDHNCSGSGFTYPAPGFKASTAPAVAKVTFDYAALGAIEIKSPKPGSPISSGGYFGVTAVATNIAAGTEVKLTLDGRAKATAKVAADGLIRFEKIPAQAGKYSVRWGTPGAYLYSNEVSLDIKPFGITRFNEGGTARDTFQVATGNWAKGTKILLTKDGKAVASGRVAKVGQAIAIVYNAGPGTYQVRVDSNQGPVYGLAGGVVVIK